jgi:hypothetical protein
MPSIWFTDPLPIGNAVRLFLRPPSGAVNWVLLRKKTNDIVAHNDPTASVIHSGTELVVLDDSALVNGTTYFYQPFFFDGTSWTTETATSVVPASTYTIDFPDPLSVMRDRLDYGLQDSIARGRMTHSRGKIQVLNSPPLASDVAWPVVTVEFAGGAPDANSVGAQIGQGDAISFDQGDEDGWISRVSLHIVGWALNPDERITLRREIERIVVANIPLFNANGMYEVTFSPSADSNDYESYSAPVYMTSSQFSCVTTSNVVGNSDYLTISDIPVVATAINP